MSKSRGTWVEDLTIVDPYVFYFPYFKDLTIKTKILKKKGVVQNFQMSLSNYLVDQYWLGASHLTEFNKVPGHFRDVLRENPTRSYRYREGPILDVQGEDRLKGQDLLRGGRRMTKPWVSEVVGLILRNEPRPSLYVICIGSNDIRDEATPRTVRALMQGVGFITSAVLNTKGAVVIFVSPVPDDKEYTDGINRRSLQRSPSSTRHSSQRVVQDPLRQLQGSEVAQPWRTISLQSGPFQG